MYCILESSLWQQFEWDMFQVHSQLIRALIVADTSEVHEERRRRRSNVHVCTFTTWLAVHEIKFSIWVFKPGWSPLLFFDGPSRADVIVHSQSLFCSDPFRKKSVGRLTVAPAEANGSQFTLLLLEKSLLYILWTIVKIFSFQMSLL